MRTDARFATAPDGVRIAYEVAGTGSPALVFVHGWTCNRGHWRAQIDRFSTTSTTVAIDLGGHGESSLGRPKWSMAAFGRDVISVLHAERLRNAILVGHSMGGRVIVEAAHQLPEAVIGIVAADTFKTLRSERSETQRKQRLDQFTRGYESAAREFIANMFLPGSSGALADEITTGMLATPSEVGIGALADMMATEPSFERVKAVAVSKYAINSDFRPIDHAAAKDAGVEVILMSGVGHFVMLEDPDTFNRHLEKAVSEVVRSR